MDSDKLIDNYLEKINGEVFGKLSVKECGRIYTQQDIPAMTELLKQMHTAFYEVYHTDCLDSEYEWVMLPAVIRSQKSGLLTVGIVTLDLQSSGEHWGTHFLTPAGIVDLHDTDHNPAFRDRMIKEWIPYDYYYTPFVEDDIHVNYSHLPETVSQMLDACRADETETDILEEAEMEDDLEL